MPILRQSTAQLIRFGKFVDSTDGNTAETALTITQANMQLSKDGAAFAQKGTAGNATHDARGWYSTTLSTTDTDTVGELVLEVEVAGALYVTRTWYVVAQTIYDTFYAGAAEGIPTLTAIGDTVWDEELVAGHIVADSAGSILGSDIPSEIAAIGTASGSSINFEAIEDNTGGAIVDAVTFVGVVQSGTFAVTEAEDGVIHDIDATVDDIDIVYGFDVGGARVGTSVTFAGFVQGNSDIMQIEAYDHVGSDWEIIGTIAGTNGTTNRVIVKPLLIKHTGTGVESGKVYIRFDTNSTTPSNLSVDKLLVSAVNRSETAGYEGGFIYFNSGVGNAGTEAFFDGTAENPVSTWAAVKSLVASTNVSKVDATGTLTLDASAEGITLVMGNRATLNLGNQNCGNTEFSNFKSVSGIGTTSSDRTIFTGCLMGAATLPETLFRGCGFTATVTAGSSGQWSVENCWSAVDGTSTPIFDFNSTDNNNIGFTRWSRGITISGLSANDTMTINGVMNAIVLNGVSPTVNISGQYGSITNNLTGTPTLTLENALDVGDLSADIRAINGSTAAAAQLALSVVTIVNGAATATTLTTTTMSTGLTETTNEHYNGRVLIWTSGALINQASSITGYNGTTKTLTFAATTEAPSDTDTFIIV